MGYNGPLLPAKFKGVGASLLVHVAIAALLAILAARRVLPRRDEPPIEIEIVAPPAPAPVPPPPKAAAKPLPVPSQPRPARVPERVRIRKVSEPRPFQADAPTAPKTREAPPEVESVPRATAPVFDMEMTVGVGDGEYVTTSSAVGSVPVRAGRGGGRGGGAGRGLPGPLANQGAADVAVARDWEITSLPEPLNDGDFEPEYPALARREGREARVVLRLTIDAAGRVRTIETVAGPRRHGFIASARDYARRLRFAPARKSTRAVASRIDWTVYFYVRN